MCAARSHTGPRGHPGRRAASASAGSRRAPAHAATCSDSVVRDDLGGGGWAAVRLGWSQTWGGRGAGVRLRVRVQPAVRPGGWGVGWIQAWGLGWVAVRPGCGVEAGGDTTRLVSRSSSQQLAGDGWPHAPRRHALLPGRAVEGATGGPFPHLLLAAWAGHSPREEQRVSLGSLAEVQRMHGRAGTA